MPTTPPVDNKQEPVEYTTDPVGPDIDEEALLRFKSKFTMDEIKENFKLLGPTTTYCMTREEMAEALKDILKKVERGYYGPLYLGEKRLMDTYLSCVGPVCSIQMKEEEKDNDC